jgi:hypothetical protein
VSVGNTSYASFGVGFVAKFRFDLGDEVDLDACEKLF